ncbi:Hypothetical protein CAP_4971 [Chondromyces apiculatus DSM 436]|uniref:Uncharacterized protein n=1 Tax=Chondromyces apiculatus DSM 436 TaxID=1192034 RepID=A0A017THN6_9BACT|nr:Hypothetical protein CAP_4971 [Chondromyces apiculatus DSM 436]
MPQNPPSCTRESSRSLGRGVQHALIGAAQRDEDGNLSYCAGR